MAKTTAGRGTTTFGAGKFPSRSDPSYPDNRIGLSAPMTAGNIEKMAVADQHSAGAETMRQAKEHFEK